MGIAKFEILGKFAEKVTVSMACLWSNNEARRAQIYGIQSYMTNKHSTLVQVLRVIPAVLMISLSLRYAAGFRKLVDFDMGICCDDWAFEYVLLMLPLFWSSAYCDRRRRTGGEDSRAFIPPFDALANPLNPVDVNYLLPAALISQR
jgi:hypothetical protein